MRPVLDIKVNSVAPDFRILLFPYSTETGLPLTKTTGNVTTIKTSGGQADELTFTPNQDGRTRIQVKRM